MISPKEVKKIAKLSCFKLTDKESAQYAKELSSVIDFFEILKKIDTKNTEPLLCSTDLEDVYSEDRVKPRPNNKEIIKRSPNSHKGYVKTKAILNNQTA